MKNILPMKLTKSTHDRLITGVCGGIAEYFGWDTSLVRIAFVLFTFFGMGSAVLIYLVLTFLMPGN